MSMFQKGDLFFKISLLFVFSVKKKTKKNNEYMPGTLLFDAFIGHLSEQNYY